MDFTAPAGNSLERFHAILREEFGIPCTVRQEKGQVRTAESEAGSVCARRQK